MTEWEHKTRKPWIVCAACKYGDFIACGPRHFDDTMRPQVEAYIKANGLEDSAETWGAFDQGFVDQYGDYHSREDAIRIVIENGQPFDQERNGGGRKWLFSEGLY
jgi:hypothetical protein